ncbi:MAG: VTT domain-containing protein [Deltaproteobacteria bacterium]|nr:VTT domain-containing protein [Deltaproteobacteria bacterium]
MGEQNWLKRNFIPLLTLIFVVVITVGIFFYREQIAELGNYRYLGAFIISLASNATVILPVPGLLFIFALGALLPSAVLVGLAGGTGAAIGEISGYLVGYSGRGVVEKNKLYLRLVNWVKRWGALAIFIFTLVPFFPFDLAGIAAGVLRFPFWKFLIVCWAGRTILYIGVAWGGAMGWEALLNFLG